MILWLWFHIIFLLKVRFALSSSAVFSRTDTTTDSERFYDSVIEIFEDPDERLEVNDLLIWWNRYDYWSVDCELLWRSWTCRVIFPQYSSAKRPPPKNSALSKIREYRARKKTALTAAPINIAANSAASWLSVAGCNFFDGPFFLVFFRPPLSVFWDFCPKFFTFWFFHKKQYNDILSNATI